MGESVKTIEIVRFARHTADTHSAKFVLKKVRARKSIGATQPSIDVETVKPYECQPDVRETTLPHTTSKTWALRAGEPFRYLGFHIPLGQRCSDRMPKFSTFMIGAESEVAHIRPALLWPCCTSEAKPFLVKQIPLTDQGNRPSITAVFGAVTASPSVLGLGIS